MERIDQPQHQPRRRNNIWVGLLILLIGAALLVKQINYWLIPGWVFSWQMLLIAIGVFVGIRNQFKNPAWFILVVIGGIFLLDRAIPGWHWHSYMWPLALIVLGLFVILRPKHRRDWGGWDNWKEGSSGDAGNLSDEDVIDYTTFFGGVHKNILSKNFKGGEIVTVFGGTEINMIQADIQGRVTLDITSIFGGTKLIIPSSWQVKSEVVAIFGGINDKRQAQNLIDSGKVLVLDGTSIFGGIEIVSY